MDMKILYLEDEQTIADVTQEYLRMQNYDVTHVSDGDSAWELLSTQVYDLAILDIMVPNKSGLEILEALHQEQIHIPVIMLSALGDESTQLQAFNYYADDYIIKPFSPILLLKRIDAIIRRTTKRPTTESQAPTHALSIDDATYQAYYNQESLNLTVTEFMLLQTLANQPNRVFSRAQLLEQIFPDDYYPTDRVIDAHIKNLRKKLPQDYIKTVIGIGYQFIEGA